MRLPPGTHFDTAAMIESFHTMKYSVIVLRNTHIWEHWGPFMRDTCAGARYSGVTGSAKAS